MYDHKSVGRLKSASALPISVSGDRGSLFAVGKYIVTDTIFESRRTRIYKAQRASSPVADEDEEEKSQSSELKPGEIPNSFIIKTINSEAPTIEAIAPLRHEFRMLKQLRDVEGVVTVAGLESFGKGMFFRHRRSDLFVAAVDKPLMVNILQC